MSQIQHQQSSNHLNGHAHEMDISQDGEHHSGTGPSTAAGAATSAGTSAAAMLPPVPHIRIVPHLDAPRSLHFEVVDKDVPQGFVLKIGRFTDKQALPNRVTFKSKVVSRGHAEIYTDQGKVRTRTPCRLVFVNRRKSTKQDRQKERRQGKPASLERPK
jgi:hypothetical protein